MREFAVIAVLVIIGAILAYKAMDILFGIGYH